MRPGFTRRIFGTGVPERASASRWHFLYLRPLLHQQGSFGPGRALESWGSFTADPLL
jgi:hypothetical protein